MKKISIVLVYILMTFTLTACSGIGTAADNTESNNNEKAEEETMDNDSQDENKEVNQEEEVAQDNSNDTSKSKVLIAYFTRADNVDQEPDVDAVSRASFNVEGDQVYGNTELLARYINESVTGDLFSIRVVDPYPYDVDETIDNIANGDPRTTLVEDIENIDEYETIFIGYPNWYATMPQPVLSFLENHDLSGKTIIPFTTHRGSQWGSSLRDLEELCPDSTILDGFVVGGDDALNAKEDVNDWLTQIGY